MGARTLVADAASQERRWSVPWFPGCRRICGFALLFALGLCPASAGVRRALVVGIDRYSRDAPLPWKPTAARPVILHGEFKPLQWPELKGAVADAQAMQAMLLENDFLVVPLLNDQATADRILAELGKLVDKNIVKAGDSSLFYFAGHGSRIRNLKAPVEGGRMDVTILPYDAPAGVPAIRGKELAQIYRRVPDGVSLTVIQDNCYSGGGARGLAPPLVTRDAPDDSRWVDDPPDTGTPVDQQKNAVLVIAASAPTQKAEELPGVSDYDGKRHGRFTDALLRAVQASVKNDSAQTIFQLARNYMQAGNVLQEPILLGRGRAEKGLFGQDAIPGNAILPQVKDIAFAIKLDRGQATGLRLGCELRQVKAVGKTEANPKIRLKITKMVGADQAEADLMPGTALKDVHIGDQFMVDRWAATGENPLTVYVPEKPPPLEELQRIAKEVRPAVARLGLTWIADPTAATPDFIVRWDGGGWGLDRAAGKPEKIGPALDAAKLQAAMKGAQGRFFLELPPPAEWLPKALNIGPGTENPGIKVIHAAPAGAQYALAGAADDRGRISYAWISPNLTQAEIDQRLRQFDPAKAPLTLALPLHTDWTDSPEKLTDYALRLAKLRGWLLLKSVAPVAPFPYRLALKEIESGRASTNGELLENKKYRVVLRSDQKTLDEFLARYEGLAEVGKTFVYVFAIDSHGKSTLLFPLPGDPVGNHLPVPETVNGKRTLPLEIAISKIDLEITPPFGVDTYSLLVTAKALGRPEVLSFDGVETGEMRGGLDLDDLGQLLVSVGEGSRGVAMPTPSDWDIQRWFFRSVPARTP